MIQFNKKRGLCSNLTVVIKNADLESDVFAEMTTQFTLAGLDDTHPFGMGDYHDRKAQQTQHLCPRRLQWAFKHWNSPEPTQSPELTKFYGEWYKWAIAQSN